jgi:hypothetical protein
VAAEPTEQDVANAEMRQAIADKFRSEYIAARELAELAFGPGWLPQGRHSLVSHDEEERARQEGGRAKPAAEVFTAEKDGVRRHFTMRDGVPVECASYQEGFGEMLFESDPVRGFERDGVFAHVHKHSLYWAGYEPGYRPQSADSLAVAREKRQQKALEKEAEGTLFAEQIRAEGYVPKRR